MLQLYTDTNTDITLEEANKYGYKLISMPYLIDGNENYPYVDWKVFDYHTYYESLRKGVMPTTCAISPMAYLTYFEEEFKNGNDILYVHFSRNMSGTFNAMNLALEELKEKYPERKVYLIDTKGITILSNIIVKEIGDMFLNGKTLEEVLAWAETEVDHYATYFFADTLSFFRRSGRVGGVSAVMGNLIGIKPIIYMDPNGTMTNIGKERGRHNAVKKLISYVDELNIDITKHRVVIGHTDALEIAKQLGNLLIEKYGELQIDYVPVNPTAGSHCGPDTVGVAFYAKHK
jgi:DegV family protein with EDD domain